MKLHRLEVEGFGPFRERQVVDFDAFDADGIFLISGRTGAGKSSVLDAVSFALYASVPRYDDAEKRLRSDHCDPSDPSTVELEFTAAGRHWRVRRTPEYTRPKKNGTGVTTAAHQAWLEERVEDEWIGRAARPRDVGIALDDILGLSAVQFQQVILLAQNRFARFLLADNRERQTLLRTLFGTRTYEGYANALDDRRRAAERELAGDDAALRAALADAEDVARSAGLDDAAHRAASSGEHTELDTAGRVAAVVRAAERAHYRAEVSAQARADAEAAMRAASNVLAEQTDVRRRQVDRAAARERLNGLEERREEVERLRTEYARAAAAERVMPAVRSADRATTRLQSARDRVRELAAGADAPPEQTVSELRARLDSLARELGELSGARDAEAQLDEAEREHAALRTEDADVRAARASTETERAALPEALTALESEASRTEDAQLRMERADDDLAALDVRLAHARTAQELATEAVDAETELVEAQSAVRAALDVSTTLLRRRLAGHAGELAAALVEGEPCSVCGSRDHPHPAQPVTDAVTDDDLDRAERDKDAAASVERASAERAANLRSRLADARAGAGGDLDDLLARAEAVRAQWEDASRAVAEGARLRAERERLLERRDRLEARIHELDAEAARTAANVAVAQERVATLRRVVEGARGDHPSVAERVADRERHAAAVEQVLEASRAVAEAETAAQSAADELAEALRGSDFPGVDEVRAAALPEADREQLDRRVREHDADLTAARQAVLTAELEALPEDEIDLTGPRAAHEDAQTAFADAARRAAEDEHRGAELRADAERADALFARLRDRIEEFDLIAALADAVAGRGNEMAMSLETFVLAAELEEIVKAANLRLDAMSAGRYRLRHTDARARRGASSGLGIEVVDAWTGRARSAHSLSGGETFLASLALALGLAQVVTDRAGGVRLDTLFIDEGFGSLDAETLETAMRTLDELRQGGRTVGVISHVDAMRAQIPAQLRVRATPAGPSVIEQTVTITR